MPETAGNAMREPRRLRNRALRPLLVWLVGSAVLAAWYVQRHGASVFFSITVDGALPAAEEVSAQMYGHPFAPGNRVRLGRRTLMITGQDIEPLERKVLVWFGNNNLGEIRLARSKGSLEVNAEPAPREIRVAGVRFVRTNSSAVATFTAVPVGEYRVTVVFDRFSEERAVQVRRNETSRLEVKPPVGTLSLSSEPPGASFSLAAASGGSLRIEGNAPTELRQLPPGEYQLRVWRGDYVKELRVPVAHGQTNRQHVVLDYGEVKLATAPPGATILKGGKELGRTPTTIGGLKPERYVYRLDLDGYLPVDLAVDVRGKESIAVSTNLTSRRYVSAMDRARWQFSSDAQGALAAVEEALQAQPGDADATALKAKIEATLKKRDRKLAEAKAVEERRKAEQEARSAAATGAQSEPAKTAAAAAPASANEPPPASRQQRAEEQFRQLEAKWQDRELFDLNVWRARAGFQKVREALLRYVEKGPDKWMMTNEAKLDEKMSVFRLDPKGFFSDKKAALVQLCELSEDETEIRCKIWIYTVGQGMKWVPVHSQFYFPENPGQANAWRDRVTRRFRENLAKELGTELK
jgi:hypothetical protein